MDVSIATATQDCIKKFAALCTAIRKQDQDSLSKIPAFEVADQQARFFIWAHNIGALRQAHAAASLDQRLRDAVEIAKQVLELLRDLGESLQDRSSTPVYSEKIFAN